MRIGVVVPTLDGGTRWLRCLAALAGQEPAPAALVVVDSGSRDGSDRAAEEAGARVLRIAREDFDHGETRNLGVRALPGVDVVVLLVQDAIPLGRCCLALLAAAARRPGVAAATARQVAPPEAGALTASTVSASPFASDLPRTTGPLATGRERLLLDDVASAVRAELLLAAGFPRTSHGEDAWLAHDLLAAGWSIAHEPAALVEHGHAYGPADVGPRYRADAVFFRERFACRVRPHPGSALKGLLAECRRDRERGVPLGLSLPLRWSQVRAQLSGSRGPCGGPPPPRTLPRP